MQDPYAGLATFDDPADPYAGLATFDAPTPKRPPVRRPGMSSAAPQMVAPEDPFDPGFEDNIPMRMDLGAPGSESNPINTALMSDEAKLALTPGTWILGPNGEPRQLSLPPSRSPTREGDQYVDGANFREQSGQGYAAALDQERTTQARRAELGHGVGFTDQFTAPLNDELGWAVGYGSQALGNLIRRLQGRDIEVSALGRANAVRDIALEEQDRFSRDHPVQSFVGQTLGGFALAPGRITQGASAAAQAARASGVGGREALQASPGILGRIAQGATIGGGYGAAEGDSLTNRAANAGIGFGLGAATGGLLEGSMAGISAARRGIQSRALPQAARDEDRVAGLIHRNLRRDNVPVEDFKGLLRQAPEEALPFEVGGSNMLGLAESAATLPGAAQQRLTTALGDRAATATDRVLTRLAEDMGSTGSYFANLDDSIARRGVAAREGMAALADTMVPLSDDAVRAFRSGLSSKAVREAALEATADLSDDASRAANRLFSLGDTALDNPAAAQISVREAQDISYALKEAASRAYRGGFNSRGEALQNLSNAVRQNARDTVPAYDQWLRAFGDASEHIDAERLGFGIFGKAGERNPVSAAQLQRRFNDMSDVAKDAFRRGVGEAIVERARGTRGGIGAMRDLLRSSEFGDRVRVAFPTDEAFESFMRFAGDELRFSNNAQRVLQNSPTARRQQGMADLQSPNGIDTQEMVGAAADAFTGNAQGLIARLTQAAARRWPNTGTNIASNERTNKILGDALTDRDVLLELLDRSASRGLLGEAGKPGLIRGLLTPSTMAAATNERGLLR